jgi:hypothetical protein
VHAEHGHGIVTDTLVDMITSVLPRYENVLYLSWCSNHQPKKLPRSFSKLDTVPFTSSFEEQFLCAKEKLLGYGPDIVELCGVSHDICVMEFRDLVNGRANAGPYFSVAKSMGWSKNKMEEIMYEKLNVRIKKNLTDANPIFY